MTNPKHGGNTSEKEPVKIMKCGCTANGTIRRAAETETNPGCVIHSCTEVLENQPVLEGRKARCSYYGKEVKKGNYNGCCCNDCSKSQASGDGLCHCERDSSSNLWFFESKPEQEFDEYYCACHGAD